MHTNEQRRVGALALLLAVLLLVPGALAANLGQGLELSPPAVDYLVEPGTERSFDVLLANSSDSKPLEIKVWLSPIEQARDGGYRLTQSGGAAAGVSWLKTGQNTVSLPPKGQKSVPVTVKVPRNASGSMAAAVVFEIVPEGRSGGAANGGGSTAFVHRMLTIVKATVKSNASRRDASLEGISVATSEDPRFAAYGKSALAVVCPVRNEGNTIIAGQGRLLIRNATGRRVRDVPLGAGRGIVLPGAVVDFVSVFPGGLPEGEYTAEVSVYYGGARPLLAKSPFRVSARGAKAGESDVAKTVRLLVSPEQLEAQLPVGAFRTFILSLQNREAYPLKVSAALKSLATDAEGNLATIDTSAGAWSAVPWLKLEGGEDLVLEPGEKRTLRLTAAVPKTATDGTRYAVLGLDAEPQNGKAATNAITTINTMVLINAGKKLTREAALMQPGVAPLEGGKGLVIGSTVANRGNTHIKPSGSVVLRRRGEAPKLTGGLEYLGEGKFEDLVTLSLEGPGLVLPGTSAPMAAVFTSELQNGEYEAEFTVDYGEKVPLKGQVRFVLAPPGALPEAENKEGLSQKGGSTK